MGKSKELAELGDAVTVDGSNIGIGTGSPAHPLDVTGTIRSNVSTTGDLNFYATSTGGGSFRIYPDDATTANPTWQHQSNSNEDQAWVIGGVERMRIDSSGNVVVGRTNVNTFDVVGHGFRSDGVVSHTADSQAIAYLNRETNDGDLVVFRKDNSTVGSIGVFSSDNLGITGSASSHAGVIFGTNQVLPASSGTYADAAVDVGNTSNRFKDLYLSGGVHLGGIGSSNKLDDYEEGTWTPSYPTGWTGDSLYATYTKVGRFCYYNAKIFVDSTGSGSFYVGGLPFTNGIYAKTHGGQMFEQVTLSTSRTQVVGFTTVNSNSHEFYQLHNTGGSWSGLTSSHLNSNSEFYIQGVIVTS